MMEELDQSASSAVEKEKSTTSVPAQGNGDQSSELIIQENDDLLSLIISDSEGEEQEPSIAPSDSTDSGLKNGENAPDITGIAPLEVTREENTVGDTKHDDKEAKERSSKEGDVGAAEKSKQAEIDNIDLTGSSSSEESFNLSPFSKKRSELFNSLLTKRSSTAVDDTKTTTLRAECSDLIKFNDEVDKDSSSDPAEKKQKQQTEISTEAGEAASTKRQTIISDSEREEQETSIVPSDSTDSGLKGGENVPDITGIAPLEVTREALSENTVGDTKLDDKEAKERSSKEGDVGAAEKPEQAENDNIDLTGSSSSVKSFLCDRGENKGPANQLKPERNDGKKNVTRPTNINTTAEELFNSLLGERSSAAITETTCRAERSDMIKFSDEVDKNSSSDPAEKKQKAVDPNPTNPTQQTEMSTEASEAAGIKRLPEKIGNVSGVTETAETNDCEVNIRNEDADVIASQKKDASTVPTALHEKRSLKELEEDGLAKRAIEADEEDGLAVDEAHATQSDEHQVPIVSTSDEIDEPPRKKQKSSKVISTGDEVAIVLSESLPEPRNGRENSCESMNSQTKRRGSVLSEIKDDKTVETNRSSSALSSAEMLPNKPTALEVLVIDDDDEEMSNPRPTEALNDTKKLEDGGKRDLHTSGLENTDSITSAKRAKMAECGTLSDEKNSLPDVNLDTKNEDDKDKKRKDPIVLRMDFLRRFARPLKTMTHYDLEVLLMQKITEAIVNGEEMAEMRQLLAKQDAMLTAYRQRITDLSKRLGDITLIQTKVLIELEKRSNRQVLPVKITRNVGLQISPPRPCNGEVEDNPLCTRERSVTGSTSPITGPKECLPNSPKNVSLTSANGPSQTPQTNAAKPVAAAYQTVANLNKHSGTNAARPPQTVSLARNSMVSSNGALLSNGATNKQTATAPSSCDRRSTNTPNPKTTESSTTSSNTSVMNGNNVARNASDSNQGGTRKSCHKFTPMRAPMSAQQQAQHLKHAREQQEYMVQQQIKSQQAQRQLQTHTTGKTDKPKGNAVRKSTSADSVQIPRPLTSGVRREPVPTSRPPNSSLIDLTDEDDVPRKSTSTTARPTLRMNANVTPRSSSNVVTSSTNGQLTRVSEQTNQQRSQGTEKHVLNGQIRSSLSQKPTTTSAKSTMVAKVVPLVVSGRRPSSRHPAPLPMPLSAADTQTPNPAWGLPPPQPAIRINNVESGIVISWGMDDLTSVHAGIESYQIYAYQETSETATPDSWRHVGNVDALNLPMAVTLTHFQEGQRYHFAVRAIDVHKRIGQFSEPRTWSDRQN